MSSSSGGWSSRRPKPVKSEGEVVDLGAKFGINVGSDSDSSDAEFAPETAERDSADSGGGSSSGEEGGDEGEEGEGEEGEREEGEGEEGEGEEGEGEEGEGEEGEGEEGEGEEGEGEREKEEEEGVGEEGEERVSEAVCKVEDSGDNHSKKVGKETNIAEKSEETSKDSEMASQCEEECRDEDRMGENGEEGVGDGSVKDDEYNPLIVRRSNRAIKPTKDVDLYLLGAKFGIDVDGLSGPESSDIEFSPAEDPPDSLSESSVDDAAHDESGIKRKGKKKVGKGGEEEEMVVGVEASNLQTQKGLSEDEFSRSVSEMSITQEAMQQVKVEIHVALCAVCLEDSMDGDIVECDRCGISVHEGCYGVPEDAAGGAEKSSVSSFTTIPWFCDACKAGVDPLTCPCELCPVRGGLYKQATNGHWVHMVCSLYTPGIEYVEPTLLSGVTLDCISAVRWGAKRCQLCEDEFYSRTGVCIGCDAGLCKSFFHSTCAQHQGLLCEMDSDDENTDMADPYFAHCRAHSDKTTLKRKRRDFLTVLNQQKRFKFNESDERTVHYLSEAKTEYTRFFKRMINYYRPELTAHYEDRFFHFKPSALRRLTMKAQLLGFSIEMEPSVHKRKIVPDLTIEFVNHFNERQSRQKELLELEKKLTAAYRDLREEELKMKHKVVSMEKELNALRIEGQELRGQLSALLVSLSRLSGETVTEGEGEGEEGGGKEEKGEGSGEPKCAVCDKTEDSHLMALCDTCQRHYHVHCLDPPLSRVPKKTSKWGWQCHRCCIESGDDLAPTIANFDEPASRCGRKINAPKVFTFPEDQVKQSKQGRKSVGKSKKAKT